MPAAVSECPWLREPGKERTMKTAEHITVGVRHPLDPLTAAEIEAATSILKRDRGLADSARFVYVTLREPAKDAVLNYQPGQERSEEHTSELQSQSNLVCRLLL